MWPVATHRPTIEAGRSVVSKTTSFAAVLADSRWTREDIQELMQGVVVQLLDDHRKASALVQASTFVQAR